MSELDLPKRLIEFGDKPGAVSELTRILQADPQDVDAWFLMVDALEDPEKKADCYRQILRLDPDNQFAQIHYQKLLRRPFVAEDPETATPRLQPSKPQPIDPVAEFRRTAVKKPAPKPAEQGLFGLDYQTTVLGGVIVFLVVVLLLFFVVLGSAGLLSPQPTPTPTRIVLPPTWTPTPPGVPQETPAPAAWLGPAFAPGAFRNFGG
jgi:hypothetical protein